MMPDVAFALAFSPSFLWFGKNGARPTTRFMTTATKTLPSGEHATLLGLSRPNSEDMWRRWTDFKRPLREKEGGASPLFP